MVVKEELVNPKELVTVAEAAKRIGIHSSTLYRWIRKSKVRVINVGGYQDFLHVDDVERLKQERRK